MISLKILAYLLLCLEVVLFLRNYKTGLGFFFFIYWVFPANLRITEVLSLDITRFALIIALCFFIREIYFTKSIKLIRFPLKITLLIFSFLLIPSYLFSEFSDGFPKGVYSYLIYFFTNNFLAGIILFQSIQSSKDASLIIKWMVFAIAMLTFYGIFEYASGYNNIFWSLMQKEFNLKTVYDYYGDLGGRFGLDNRIKSTNIHPITYGGRLALFVPLFMMLFADSKTWKVIKSPLILGFVFLLLLINIYLTASRSCWIAAIICFGLIFFFERKHYFKRYATFKLVSLALITLPLIIVLIPVFINYSNQADKRGSSVYARTVQYNYIFDRIVNKDYLMGHGPDAVAIYIESGVHPPALGFESILFEIFVNNGLLGFIGYMLFYVSVSVLTFKNLRSWYCSSYMLAITVAHIVFVFITGERYTIVVYWCMLCLFLKINYIKTSESKLVSLILNNSTNEATKI